MIRLHRFIIIIIITAALLWLLSFGAPDQQVLWLTFGEARTLEFICISAGSIEHNRHIL